MFPKRLKVPIGDLPKNSQVISRDENATVRLFSNSSGINRLGVSLRAKAFKSAALRNKLRRAVFNFFAPSKQFPGSSLASKDVLVTLEAKIGSFNRANFKKALTKHGEALAKALKS